MSGSRDGADSGRVIEGEYHSTTGSASSGRSEPGPGDRGSSPQGEGMALGIYILYLVGTVTGIVALVGIVLAYVYRGDARNSWLESHYRFLIRTFWIGLLYLVIATILLVVFIGYLLMLILLVWWVVRCALGIRDLLRQRGVPNPATWGFY